MLFDGGKRGLTSKLQSPWKVKSAKKDSTADEDAVEDEENPDDEVVDNPSKTVIVPSLLNVGYDADSVAARKKIVRGTMSLKQMEGVNLMSHNKISLPEKSWGNYPGTNQGDTLLGVILPPFDAAEVWKLTWKQKKALYGKKHLIAVGGKTVGMGPLEKRVDSKVEPVVYNPMPCAMFEALFKGFFVKIVFDLTSVDSTVGWTCICNGICYIGICFTDEHCELLYARYLDLLKVEMANSENTAIYNAQYALAIGKKKPATAATTGTAKAKSKAAAKGKAKKAAAKKKPKASEEGALEVSDDEDEDDDDGDDEDDEVWDPMQD